MNVKSTIAVCNGSFAEKTGEMIVETDVNFFYKTTFTRPDFIILKVGKESYRVEAEQLRAAIDNAVNVK